MLLPDRVSESANALMRHLHWVTTVYVDFETRSAVNIKKCGAYRYVSDPSTSVLCLGYSVDGATPQLWVPGMPVPKLFYQSNVVFVAHNVQFDRLVFNRFIFQTRVEQWDDTMVRCVYHGLPAALDDVGKHVFGMRKDPRGAQLINNTQGKGVCQPQKKRATKNHPARVYWNNDPEALRELGEYCLQDVNLLIAIDTNIPHMPEAETRAWWTFEHMNDNGVQIDIALCLNATKVVGEQQIDVESRLPLITNGLVETSGQTQKIVSFVNNVMGDGTMANCGADTVTDILMRTDLPASVREVLSIRQMSNSAAVKKYQAALDRVCDDGRVRGSTIFYGAHTGRSTSKGVQLQNSKRGKEKYYLGYCEALSRNDFEPLLGWTDWNHHLSYGVRRIFIAKPGHMFIVDDYSGIEARTVDWLVGDEEGLERHRNKVDEYVILASSIFGQPIESITGDQRSVGKEARLAGQYGIGAPGYRRRLAIKWGVEITEGESVVAINTFRRDRWRIVQAWGDIRRAWRSACIGVPTMAVKCMFSVENNWMRVTAPDNRSLYYYAPSYDMSYGVVGKTMKDPDTGKQIPLRKRNYGGAQLENIAQWISGNVARDHMTEIHSKGVGSLCFMVHDELILEALISEAQRVQTEVERIMCTPPWWAPDLPLAVEGWIGPHYKKG